MPTDPSDEELMLLYQHDNAAAGAMLFERYQGPLFGYLVRTLGNRSEAEEVLQDVFLKVHERRGQYLSRGKVKGWLYRIAANDCVDRLRRRSRRPEGHVISLNGDDEGGTAMSEHRTADRGSTPRDAASESELEDRLENAIGALPESQRMVFLLRQRGGLEYGEISSILSVPEGRLRVQFHRARRFLFEKLKPDLVNSEDG